jgi:transposase InsO family protein
LDLFSRKVVGWSMSSSLSTEVITAAMRKAIQARRPSAGTLLHHSDRGCQYTSESFQDLLRTLQITCSMTPKYRCSSTSQPFTIRCVFIRRSNTSRPINSDENRRCR